MFTGDEVIIQFLFWRLDLRPFKLAYPTFGPKVPEIKLLQDQESESEGVWGYWMARIQPFSSGFEFIKTIKASP